MLDGTFTVGAVVSGVVPPVSLLCASASGTINGIDGGINSMLTRKIPKNIVRLFFSVLFTWYNNHLGLITVRVLFSSIKLRFRTCLVTVPQVLALFPSF